MAKKLPNLRRLVIEEIEPRILYSADFGPALLQAVPLPFAVEQRTLDASGEFVASSGMQQTIVAAEYQRHEIVFVDIGTPDYEELVEDITSRSEQDLKLEIVLLDTQSDGIGQISALLSSQKDISAVHIISHGSEGQVQLGASMLNFDSLLENATQIKGWAQAFNADADVLIYGCDVAQAPDGKALIDALSRLTAADVAASEDLTGGIDQGGNWTLEYNTGRIDSQLALSYAKQINWDYTLATYTVINTGDAGAGSLRQAMTDANLAAGADTIDFNIVGGGAQTIGLTSALPTITDSVTIDATTQGGYSGTPLIELNGTGAGAGVNGLTITANNNTVRGLIVNRFGGSGIVIDGGDNNLIAGNYVGTDSTGGIDLGNSTYGIGLMNGAQNNTIGGTTAAEGNVISGNTVVGVDIVGSGTSSNSVLGNIIGLTADQSGALGNGYGVGIGQTASNNIIGDAAGGRNIISGNVQYGVRIVDNNTNGNVVQNNYIGLNASGNVHGNSSDGIILDAPASATGNVIGGTAAGLGNVISGNNGDGIEIRNGMVVTVVGNIIGLDPAGTAGAYRNLGSGIYIFNSANNTIGGTTSAQRNVISGNNLAGIYLQNAGSTGNLIRGNYIGLDLTGGASRGNGTNGIELPSTASGNTIGGAAPGAGNVISGNTQNGVAITGTGTGNVLQGNYIGTDALGTVDLGNTLAGVLVSSSSNHTIGGTAVGAGNLIFGNNGGGVRIIGLTTAGVTVQGNRIYGNTGLGIDLSGGTEDGFNTTANDGDDVDTGANDLQNYPVLTSAQASGASISITGSLNSTPGSTFRVEFFASTVGDASSHGEAQRYLGFFNVITDPLGDVAFTASWAGTLTAGESVSATATDAAGNSSEFSLNVIANSAPVLSGANNLASINEDPASNLGTLVSALISGLVIDADVGALAGIAVTAVVATNGNWQYSTNGGSGWNNFGTPSGASARLLAADVNTYVRFVPNTDWNGTVSNGLTFRAWDQTTGTAGSTGDTSSNGGSTEFSSATASASIMVNSVNDEPVGTNNTVTTPEDTQYTFAAADFGFTDSQDSPANALSAVRITSLPTAGSLTLSGIAVGGGQFVSIGNITSGDLRFTPGLDSFGVAYASFTFQVQDDGGSANGGVNLDQSAATLSIDVTAVNDAPAIVNNTLTISQGGSVILSAGDISASDIDNPPPSSLVFTAGTISHGHFELETNPGVPVLSFTAADISFAQVRFVHDGSSSAPNYSLLVSDGMLLDGPSAAVVNFSLSPSPPGGPVLPPADPSPPPATYPTPAGPGPAPGPADTADDDSSSASALSAAADDEAVVAQPSAGSLSAPAEPVSDEVKKPAPPASIRRAEWRASGEARKPVAVALFTEGSALQPAELPLLVQGMDPKYMDFGLSSQSRWTTERSFADDLGEKGERTVSPAEMAGIAMSVGAVWWTSRVSGLVGSFLASMPAWRRMDPLPVAGCDEDSEVYWDEQLDLEADADELAISMVLEGLKPEELKRELKQLADQARLTDALSHLASLLSAAEFALTDPNDSPVNPLSP